MAALVEAANLRFRSYTGNEVRVRFGAYWAPVHQDHILVAGAAAAVDDAVAAGAAAAVAVAAALADGAAAMDLPSGEEQLVQRHRRLR